jgi:mannose-6-phosphate isomerase-like protein (cupin superfamily)
MTETPLRKPILLKPGEGRAYELGSSGAMRAVFKADGAETAGRYSISEWWLEPHTPGPGAHTHDGEDDVFYVIEGIASFLIGEDWVEAPRGSFVCAPAGVSHDFANRTDAKVGLLNISTPGGFEAHMPAIVQWFKENR